jgi:chromate transporter
MLTATFIGYYLYGFLGGIVATLSIFLPSYLIVIGITPYYEKLLSSQISINMIRGILCSFAGLLLSVTIHFTQNISWDLPRLILAATALLALFLKVEIIWVVLAGMAISLLVL